jgi:aminoglycoside phosphotransferase (APT) family kinase protein
MAEPEPIGERLGSGKEAEVFAYGPDVIKLYRRPAAKGSAFREAATLALLESLDLPAPRVRQAGLFDGRWGLVMTRAEGRPFGEMLASEASGVDRLVKLHRDIHRHEGQGLPALKARLGGNIERAELPDGVRDRLLLRLAGMPDESRLCHGDFHPWNVLGSEADAIVVDWLDATAGSPAADVCRSYVLLHPRVPELASEYVEAYAVSGGIAVTEIMAWLPVIAAARLAENVPHEVTSLMAMIGAG